MNYLPELLAIAAIHFLAVASPGPDFALIATNTFKYSRKTARWSAVGLGLGIALHVTYSLIGVGYIISQSIVAFSIIKFAGAAYLIYIGSKALLSKNTGKKNTLGKAKKDISPGKAIWTGFLTNALNPKASLFFFSVFSQVVSPETPISVKVLYGIEMSFVTFVWFSSVASLLSHRLIQSRIEKAQDIITKVTGAVLILFGLRLAITKAK